MDFYAEIKHIVDILRKGGIILYPSDTVWSIACDACNYEAVKRMYELKQGKESDGMIALIENPNQLISYVDEVPDVAFDLLDFTEKPTTIVYDKAKNLASNLIAPDGSIGIRLTKEKFTQQLIQRFRKPLASTSANLSGEPCSRCFSDIPEIISSGVDYVVKYRQEDREVYAKSSIIKLGSSGLIKIIRE